MKNVDIIRAWKDEDYRLSLTAQELAALPANPAGQIELAEADLEELVGGLGKKKKGGEAPPPDSNSAGTSAGTTSGGSKPAGGTSAAKSTTSGGSKK